MREAIKKRIWLIRNDGQRLLFQSQRDLADALGVTESAISKRLRRGQFRIQGIGVIRRDGE